MTSYTDKVLQPEEYDINTKIIPLEMLDIEDEDVCDICLSSFVHKKICCKCCKKHICINCLNKLPTREPNVIENDKIEDAVKNEFCGRQDYFNQGLAQPVIEYECVYCRTPNRIFLISFMNSYDIVSTVLKDYTKLVFSGYYYNSESALQMKEKLINYDNIAGQATLRLKKEQEDHNETKRKYNELVKKTNEMTVFYSNANQVMNNIIENIFRLATNKRVKGGVKNQIINYIKSQGLIDISVAKITVL